MGQYRDAVEHFLREEISARRLPEPIIDLGGRAWRSWLAGIVGQPFETWDLLPGDDVQRVIDATKLPGVEDASLGTILCLSALEHIDRPWNAALQMARVTRPGGLVVISAPFNFPFHGQPKDYYRYAPDGLRVLFTPHYREDACRFEGPAQSIFIGTRSPVDFDRAHVIEVALKIPGLITEGEVAFLYACACQSPLGAFVELGTHQGRSCSVLAHAAASQGRVPYTLDNYQSRLVCSASITRHNLDAFGLGAHVLQQDSCKPPAGTERVACLFVDSLHTRAQFNQEMTAWLPRVIDHGILICHDYDSPEWPEMRAAIDEWLGQYEKLGQVERMIAFRKRKQ